MTLRLLATAVTLFAAMFSVGVVRGDEPAPGWDRYGDPLPAGALVRLGTTRLQTKGGFAWLPDGKSLVTLRYGKVTFWDMTDGRAIDSFYVPVGVKRSSYGAQLALSPDSKRLVCTDTEGNIAVCTGWAEGRTSTIVTPAAETEDHRENLILVMLKDGQTLLTLRYTGELEFRDTSTMAVRRTVKLGGGQWRSSVPAALSPDGKTLALYHGAEESIVLVNTEKDEEPAVIAKAHKESVYGMAWLPDGRLITSASIRIKPAAEGQAPSFQAELRLWDVAKREAIGDWPLEHSVSACGVGVSPDGETLVTVFKDRIHIWDIKTQTIVRRIENLDFWNPMSAQIEIDPGGTLLAVNDHDNYVRVWELATGKPLFGEGQHEQGLVFSSAWTADGQNIATSSRGDIFIWNASTGEVVRALHGPRYGAAGLLFSPDASELIVCGQDPERASSAGGVWWQEALTGKVLRKVETTGQARLPVLSPDRSLLAFNTRDFEAGIAAVQVVEAATGKEHVKLEGQGEYGIAWSPDGQRLWTATARGVVTQTHLATKAVVSQHQLPHQRRDLHTGELVEGRLWQSAFFRSGDRVITAGSLPELYAWDLTTGRKQWTIPTAGFTRALALSPDEKVVACVAGSDDDNKLLQLCEVASQRKLVEFDLGQEHCQCLSFSPDGRRILAGFEDGTALVMDATAR